MAHNPNTMALLRYNESAQGQVIQDYDISGGAAMEKGLILGAVDPRGVSGSIGLRAPCAGILGREIIGGSSRTRAPVHKKGYFDVVASGGIALGGECLAAGHENYVINGTGAESGSRIMGYAEEDAADDETFIMRLDL